MHRLLAIAVAGSLFVPASARASTCNVTVAATSGGTLPVGCAASVVMATGSTPRVMASRGGVMIDVTGEVTVIDTFDIDIRFVGLNEPCAPDFDQTNPAPYDTIEIALTGVEPGDELVLADHGLPLGTVVAAGECPGGAAAPAVMTCDVSQPCFPEDEVDPGSQDAGMGGCTTGGNGALGGILGLALLCLRRRR